MNRFGIFAFVSFFMSFMIFKVVDDEGAGADDVGDFEIEDEPEVEAEEKEEVKQKEENSPVNAEIEELKAFKNQMEAERATSSAIASLTEKYPNFNAELIASELQKIEKEEGEEAAERLNNPLGWENIHLKKFNKVKPSHAEFDRGRGETREPFDFKKGFEKAYGGDKSSIHDLLENSKG